MGPLPLYSVLLIVACEYLKEDEGKCDESSEHASALAAQWNMLLQLCMYIPSIVAAPVIGHLVDRVGRRPFMILACIASQLLGWGIIVVERGYAGIYWVALASFFSGVIGAGAIDIVVKAYIADTATDRTFMYSLFGGSLMICQMFAPYLSGMITTNYGLMLNFYAANGMHLVALAFCVLVLPESLQFDERYGIPSMKEMLREAFSSTATGLRDTILIFKNRQLLILALNQSLCWFSVFGYMQNLPLYILLVYRFDAATMGTYFLVANTSNFFFVAVVLPLLLRLFGQKARTLCELRMLYVSLTAYAFKFILTAGARDSGTLFAVAILCGAGSMEGPLATALISRAVPAAEGGKLFAGFSIVNQIAQGAGAAVLTTVYSQTASTFPSLFMYLSGGILFLALIAVLFVDVEELEHNAQMDAEAVA
ncbi:hypothetical protein HK101_008162 [Irineochytrium annulatum]|nr:hypothetical protein HK101_008162 [Irineochytrium annulatum]